MSVRSRRWCFTINNWTPQHVDNLQLLGYKYLVYGREVGELGTPHLQGYVTFANPRRLSTLRITAGGGHWEIAIKDDPIPGDYCKKDGDFDEFGEPPPGQGKRKDIDRIMSWLDNFIADNRRSPTQREIALYQPIAMLRYRNFYELAVLRAPPIALVSDGQPNEWQLELMQELDEDPDDRSIKFYVDEEGGKGKSWFQDHAYSEWPDRVQLMSVGKIADLACSIETDKDIFLFNVGRDCMQYLQYPILESLKDRKVFSPKYQSRMKILEKRPHVIVFCNEAPDMTKLTQDRYNIVNL